MFLNTGMGVDFDAFAFTKHRSYQRIVEAFDKAIEMLQLRGIIKATEARYIKERSCTDSKLKAISFFPLDVEHFYGAFIALTSVYMLGTVYFCVFEFWKSSLNFRDSITL